MTDERTPIQIGMAGTMMLHRFTFSTCREYLAAYRASMEAAKQGLADDATAPPEEVPEDLIAAVIASRDTPN